MRAISAIVAMTVCTAAFAQSDVVRPMATHRNVRAVSESTAKWNPQIQPSFRIGAPTPRNPLITTPPIYEENNLPVGTNKENLLRTTIGARYPGISATGWFPPDPNIAVGPNHVVNVVNTDIAWFDKATGVKQFQVSMEPLPGAAEGFFESLGTGSFVFDPKCFYDPLTSRFFVVALEEDDATQTSKALVAVSDDSDPNGTWHKYRFEAKLDVGGNQTWMDYPGFGSNKDAIVISGNQFGFTSGFPGVQVIVVPKTPLLSGAAATATQSLIAGERTAQVCHSSDPTSDKIYMVGQSAASTSMRIYAVTNLTGAPVIQSALVTIPSWTFPFFNAASAGGRELDTLDGRVFEADFRGGKIVCAHTVQVSNSDTRTMVRWYEFDTKNYPAATPTLVQSGNVIGGAGEFYHMPGIGVNAAGDIALVFTRSSNSIPADIMVTGRKATDALGVMGTPTLVKASAGATYGFPGFNRWGDYFAMEIDPVDDLTFWSVGMIGQSNGNWITEISKLTISDIIPGNSFIPFDATSMAIYFDPLSTPQTQGQNLVGDVTSIHTSNNTYASLGSVNVSKLGHVAAYEFNYQTDTSRGLPKGITVRTETSVTRALTGMVWLYDWNANKFVQIKSFPMKQGNDLVTDAAGSGSLPRFVSAGGVVRVVVRGLDPLRSGRGVSLPSPFTLKLDQVQLRVRY